MEQLQKLKDISFYIGNKEKHLVQTDEVINQTYFYSQDFIYQYLFNYFSDFTKTREHETEIDRILGDMNKFISTSFSNDYNSNQIQQNMFNSCFKLMKVNLRSIDNLKKISKNAFKNCFTLGFKDNGVLTIPYSVEEIEDNAFDSCFCLKKVVFKGPRIQHLGKNIFQNCINLEEIQFADLTKQEAVDLLRNVRLMDIAETDSRFYGPNANGIKITDQYGNSFQYKNVEDELQIFSDSIEDEYQSNEDLYRSIKTATINIIDKLFNQNELNIAGDNAEDSAEEDETADADDMLLTATTIDIATTDPLLQVIFKCNAICDGIKVRNNIFTEDLYEKLKKYVDYEYNIISNKRYYADLMLNEKNFLPSSVLPAILVYLMHGINYFQIVTNEQYSDLLSTRIV